MLIWVFKIQFLKWDSIMQKKKWPFWEHIYCHSTTTEYWFEIWWPSCKKQIVNTTSCQYITSKKVKTGQILCFSQYVLLNIKDFLICFDYLFVNELLLDALYKCYFLIVFVNFIQYLNKCNIYNLLIWK